MLVSIWLLHQCPGCIYSRHIFAICFCAVCDRETRLEMLTLTGTCWLQEAKKRHEIDRTAVKEVVCALCSLRQPINPNCKACGVSFGAYSCMQCCFFDDEVKKQHFHCDSCGICRVGGRQNFFHCPTCGCCYSTSLQVGCPASSER